MTKDELKKDMIAKHERNLRTLDLAPDILKISSVAYNHIYTSDHYADLEAMYVHLHECRKVFGKYEVSSYYEIYGRLAITYRFEKGDIAVIFYVNDVEKSLEEFSKGRCHVEKVTRVESKIVCGV